MFYNFIDPWTNWQDGCERGRVSGALYNTSLFIRDAERRRDGGGSNIMELNSP